MFHGDNLGFLRAMNSGSVDLIATDPPFNKNKDFHATPDSLAAGAKFQDRWSWEKDVHQEWVDKISDDRPELMQAIESAKQAHSDGMGAFMCFMSVRLMEMRRLLKPTGSIYLHCDPTASHYLKACMDAIFGQKNFRNEIVWWYSWGVHTANHWNKKHDIILYYAKDFKKVMFDGNRVRVPYREGSKMTTDPKWNKSYNPEGKLPEDVLEIPTINAMSKERYRYPTQKPLALYERIIKASSNSDDVVLDPFCGCATTLIAAERLNRQWVGIDLWEGSHEAVITRMAQDTYLEVPTGFHDNVRLFYDGQIHYETMPPERTDKGEEAAPFVLTPQERKEPKEPWQKLSRAEMKTHLAKAQSITSGLVLCAGCGREVEVEFTELDHITPRSDRGENDISNRILLCRPCNGKKGNRLTMPGLLDRNNKEKWMRDKNKAERARHLAEKRYKQIKYDEVPLRIGEE